MLRAVLIVASSVGLLGMGVMTAFVLAMSSAWDGEASAPIAVVGGLFGFLLATLASGVGYYRAWFTKTAVLSVVLLITSALPWLQKRDKLAGIGMITVAAM
jgi:hypothetical protein